MNRQYFFRDASKLRTTPFGIFTDQAGYPSESRKTAVMPFSADEFTVTDREGNIKYKGKPNCFGHDENSGDTVSIADFSQLKEHGIYRVCSCGKTSAEFRIGEGIYDNVLHDTAKAFYFLRCGCGLTEQYAGKYTHAPCHRSPAMLFEDRSIMLNLSGGWHDAGDYGRYVTAGACAAGHLLYAYRLFPGIFDKLELGIPKKDMPDILTEVKYELEWLLKMQRDDGAVYHKVTTMLHAPFVMPEEDKEQLYVFPVSSMAAADLTAVTALASSIYRPFDPEFSEKLRTAAEKSAEWLVNDPGFIGFINPEGCNTGGYYERDDYSNRYWAYSEMYSLTGDDIWLSRMKESMRKDFSLTEMGYSEIGGLGSLSYLLNSREKQPDLYDRLKKAFSDRAERLKKVSDSCGYGVALSPDGYHWGSNMSVMKHGMIFAVNDILNGDTVCREYAQKQADYLLGTNALGISYITGTGEFRVNEPHLRPAFADGIDECIPGMVSGGPNSGLNDPFAEAVIKKGTPPMKCFADDPASYSMNEITIYWNSPTVFVLAYLKGVFDNER